MRIRLLFILMTVLAKNAFTQDSLRFLAPSLVFNKPKFILVCGMQTAGYGSSLILLSNAWYKNYHRISFHSFDDSREWLQMDKAGHLISSWYLGRMGIDMMEWSGVDKQKAILYGTAGSFLYLSGIELLDAFSDGWGFSWSDVAANTIGTGIRIGQKFLQNNAADNLFKRGIGEISLKFSFSQTQYPLYRPFLLGNTLAENILKDYNGQTYWMSFNIYSFMKPQSKFPKWLNVACGYGGEGMISGKPGFVYVNSQGNTIEFDRYRQYYFSLDIDMTKIKIRSRFLKTVFETISFIKIPAPALELNRRGMKFYSFFY